VKRFLVAVALFAVAATAMAATTTTTTTTKSSSTKSSSSKAHSSSAAKMPDHGGMTPDDMKWGPAPPVFQAGAEMAVLQGNPGAAGQYVVRLKMPDGHKIMPYWHPTTENITVISGTFHFGTGDTFDDSKGMEMPAGSFGYVGPHMNHFAWTTGETVVQVHGQGPFKLTYVNPADDPSKAAAK
jgi:hypothetical protein